MEGKRVAIYCRVDCGGNSVTRQEALAIQRQCLERYATANRLQVVAIYKDDGFSGHKLTRPGLIGLVNACRAGDFEQVIVIDCSRLYCGSRWKEPKWPFEVYSLNCMECGDIRQNGEKLSPFCF